VENGLASRCCVEARLYIAYISNQGGVQGFRLRLECSANLLVVVRVFEVAVLEPEDGVVRLHPADRTSVSMRVHKAPEHALRKDEGATPAQAHKQPRENAGRSHAHQRGRARNETDGPGAVSSADVPGPHAGRSVGRRQYAGPSLLLRAQPPARATGHEQASGC
jgi:hypothetical protein